MGLDYVELVSALEDKFSIDIPNERAASVRTVGDLFVVVQEGIAMANALREHAASRPEDLWNTYLACVHDQLGVPMRDLIASARFDEDLRVS